MNVFIKIAAGVLITALLSLVLSKQSKDFSVLLIIAVCSMTVLITMEYMEPVIDLLQKLSAMATLESAMMKILLKSVGIGMLAEIVSLLCIDSGNATLGKTIQIFAAVMILYFSIPLFTRLIDLVDDILSAT